MNERVLENLNVLLNINRSEIEAWTYVFRSEKDNNSKKEFKDNLYQSYFDYYSNLLTFRRIFSEYKNCDDIDFNEEKLMNTIKNLATILNNFDDLFRI